MDLANLISQIVDAKIRGMLGDSRKMRVISSGDPSMGDPGSFADPAHPHWNQVQGKPEEFAPSEHGNEAHSATYLTASDIASMPSIYRKDFSDSASISVTHNLGARPVVQVVGKDVSAYGDGLYGAGIYGGDQDILLLTPSSVKHNSVNQVTVTLPAEKTGEVICIG